jgi:hypothetical protein
VSTVSTRTVPRLHRYRMATRLALLLLFVAAILGPWTYTFDGVPPAEWDMCDEPFFLLNEVRCASLVTGATILAWAPQFALGLVYEIRADPRSLLNSLFLIAFYCLLVLPFASGLLALLRGDSRRLQRLHLAFLLFAALFGGLLPVLFEQTGITVLPRFWGMWLFAAVAWAALASELLMWRRPPGEKEPQPATDARPIPREAAHYSPDEGVQQPVDFAGMGEVRLETQHR